MDPLTTLLTKYISNPERRPQRDLTGEWAETDFHTLVVSRIFPTREGHRETIRDHPRFLSFFSFSVLDDEQLARASADGTRPHRAIESRGPDPRVKRTHTSPPHARTSD